MRHFDEIFEIAAARKGGVEPLVAQLGKPLGAAALLAIPKTAGSRSLPNRFFRQALTGK